MRIGVDIRGLLTGRWSGIEQYTLKVLEHLLKLDRQNTYVLFYVSYRDWDVKLHQLLNQTPFLRQENVEVRKLRWINFPLLLHAVWKPLNWPKVDYICGGLGVMWQPSPRILPVSSRCRKVITFHDLVFELFPQFYPWQSRLWQWQMSYPYLARIADQIIAVSENTKNDLMRIYNASPQKISVIYEGVDPDYFIPVSSERGLSLRQKFNLTEEYLYYLGSLEPRKNVVAIVRALAHLRAQGVNMKLVISGAKSWLDDPIFSEIKESQLEPYIVFTGSVTEEEKIAWLQGAKAFVFPSLYEGFGLPVLEAMAAGCPVVTSKRASLPEITGDAALLIDPANQTGLNQAVEQICTDTNLSQKLSQAGQKRAREFTWEKTAQATLNVLLNGGK